MGYPRKIATCCYCGTRAALVLSGETRHELACSSCGAPLHDLKMIPKKTQRPATDHRYPAPPQKSRKRKAKRRKGWFKDVLEEAFDLVEDIFD